MIINLKALQSKFADEVLKLHLDLYKSCLIHLTQKIHNRAYSYYIIIQSSQIIT